MKRKVWISSFAFSRRGFRVELWVCGGEGEEGGVVLGVRREEEGDEGVCGCDCGCDISDV